jgi:DNA-binding IclR family transcriptional regulator
MHHHGNPEREDLRAQSGVLSLVLQEHPTLLTAAEIASEVGASDTTERAMRDLGAIGLLRREGETVYPTRAALHFDRLAA